MTWTEIEQLTYQVQQLPAGWQQTSQQLSQVMVSAHSTMIEGSRVTVLEAFDFLLGAAPTLGPGKPLAGYDMLGDHARALDLALQRADARQLPGLAARAGGGRDAFHRPAYQHGPGHGGPHAGRPAAGQRVHRRGQLLPQRPKGAVPGGDAQW